MVVTCQLLCDGYTCACVCFCAGALRYAQPWICEVL